MNQLATVALAADLSEFAHNDARMSITDAEALALVNMTDAELIPILQAGVHPRHVPYRRAGLRRAAAWVIAFRKSGPDEQITPRTDQAVRNVQQLAEQDRDPDYPRN